MVPNTPRSPRLVTSEIEPNAKTQNLPEEESPFVVTGAGIFVGSGRWMYTGIALGAAIISVWAFLFGAHMPKYFTAPRKTVDVIVDGISSSPQTRATPEVIPVQIVPENIRVTSISLGHPRLAVINGTAVAEGDYVMVHTPGAAVVVRLRVAKIGDGRVDLQNGTQLICAHLAPVTKGK
jgi:hypothetical protein